MTMTTKTKTKTAPRTGAERAQWTPPRVYSKPDGTPYRVVIYAHASEGDRVRPVCELRDPTPRDLANFARIAQTPRVIESARDLLAALYALRGYFAAHPTDTGKVSIAMVNVENALRAYDAGAGIVESEANQ